MVKVVDKLWRIDKLLEHIMNLTVYYHPLPLSLLIRCERLMGTFQVPLVGRELVLIGDMINNGESHLFELLDISVAVRDTPPKVIGDCGNPLSKDSECLPLADFLHSQLQ